MIKIRSPLEIETGPLGRWQVVLWTDDVFNYAFPFRAVLKEIAELLGTDALADLDLPPFEQNEDFIEGTLRFGETTLYTYFEYALGYLALGNNDRDCLQQILNRLQPHVRVIGDL